VIKKSILEVLGRIFIYRFSSIIESLSLIRILICDYKNVPHFFCTLK